MIKPTSSIWAGPAVRVKKEETINVGGAGSTDEITKRVAQIKTQIEDTTSEFDKEKFQERLAKLAGGVAVIQVGAATETEMKEKKLRIDDALNATRAAVEEGIVPGGGVVYISAVKGLDGLSTDTFDEKTGIDIVRRDLEEPLRQIANNAGLEGSVIVEKVKNEEPGIGFNALTAEFVNMISRHRGPGQGDRSALQNAASIAAAILPPKALLLISPKRIKTSWAVWGHGWYGRRHGRHDVACGRIDNPN